MTVRTESHLLHAAPRGISAGTGMTKANQQNEAQAEVIANVKASSACSTETALRGMQVPV